MHARHDRRKWIRQTNQMENKIGLIAGSGQFPKIFCETAIKKGFSVYTAAYVNEADPGLVHLSEKIEWLHLGQVKRLIRFFKKNHVNRAVMLGAVRKTKMFHRCKTRHESHRHHRGNAPYPR